MDLQHACPSIEHRSPQPQEQATVARCGEPFDVEAVVLARNGQERTQMRIVTQRARERVVFSPAGKPCRAQHAPILASEFAHQCRFRVARCHGNSGKQEPVSGSSDIGQRGKGIACRLSLRLIAKRGMGACNPEVAVTERETFEVRFRRGPVPGTASRRGKRNELPQVEAAMVRVSKRACLRPFGGESLDRNRFVVSEPQGTCDSQRGRHAFAQPLAARQHIERRIELQNYVPGGQGNHGTPKEGNTRRPEALLTRHGQSMT